MPIKIFLSYSHKDSDIKEELDTHFAPLKRSGKAQTWSDRDIELSSEWDEAIKRELEEADIILLLISANFIASNYIWDNELKRAMERHEAKTARVIPIFAKKCEFQDMPFAKLQGLPQDAKPIASFPDRDEPCADIATKIRKLIDNFNKPKSSIDDRENQPQPIDGELIKTLIAQNKIEKAIETLKPLLKNDAQKNNILIGLEQRLTQLRQQELMYIISFSEAQLARNQIVNGILNLI